VTILWKKVLKSFKNIAVLRIQTPDPDPDFLPIPDTGVKKAPDPGSWIRNTVSDFLLEKIGKNLYFFLLFFLCYR
jgi:hypothetical protein